VGVLLMTLSGWSASVTLGKLVPKLTPVMVIWLVALLTSVCVTSS
jgi:hypothetical protein